MNQKQRGLFSLGAAEKPLLKLGDVVRFQSNEAPSRIMPPPKIYPNKTQLEGRLVDWWDNGFYTGHIRRYGAGFPIGNGPFCIISIVAHDQTARHDFREFQQLKNHLVGAEWEGIELYPAESRLQDPSNCFYLFCVPSGVIPWGGTERIVSNPKDAIAMQRAFPPDLEPGTDPPAKEPT